eukprot:EG_transcript_3101
MALSAHLIAFATALPAPECGYEKEYVRIPMRDGVNLAASHYSPRPSGAAGQFPTVLIRTPYNRKHVAFIGRWFAGHLYHVIIQDTRGRCESEGQFDPIGQEEADGHDTVRWIRRQPWFQACPLIGAWGPSFMGIMQWAGLSTDDPQAQPDALVPIMSSAQLHSVLQPDGGLALGLGLRWHYLTHQIRADTSLTDMVLILASGLDRTCDKLFDLGSFEECDAAITGQAGSTCMGRYLAEHFGSPADDPFWQHRDFRHKLPYAPPAHLIGGWYDFFLREVLADYAALREAGRNPFLTIGPWSHFDAGALFVGLEVGLQWFDNVLKGLTATRSPTTRLKGVRAAASPSSHATAVPTLSPSSTVRSPPEDGNAIESPVRDTSGAASGDEAEDLNLHESPPVLFRLPVRLYVMGRSEWREFPAWPPPATPTLFYLQENEGLGQELGADTATTFIYDPRNPTPSVGGTEFHPTRGGRKGMKSLQRRPDVIAFTSPPLAEDLEVIGPVRLTLYARSSALTGYDVASKANPQHFTDFVARLCLVSHRLGHKKTQNVTDGYLRVRPGVGEAVGDGVLRLDIDMWATAQLWTAGQQLRLLVCSAAHPRYQAPPPVGSPVQQQILHGPRYPSSLVLPAVAPSPATAADRSPPRHVPGTDWPLRQWRRLWPGKGDRPPAD